MATARVREVEKTRMVEEKYTAQDGVILELTHQETALLAFILGHKVSGGSDSDARMLSAGIWDKLGPYGYHFRGKNYEDVVAYENNITPDCGLYFKREAQF